MLPISPFPAPALRGAVLLAVVAVSAAGAPAAAVCPPDFRRELEPFPMYDGLGPVPSPMQGGWRNPRPQLVDIDADGDLDLFVQEERGKLRFYRNAGSPSAPVWSFETDEYAGVHRYYYARFADIDSDGDFDLLVEGDVIPDGQGSSFSTAVLYTNVGTPQAPDYQNLSAHPGGFLTDENGAPIPIDLTTPDLVDLEGDGDLDLMLGEPRGSVILWRNVGTPTSPSFRFETDAYRNLDLVFGSCIPTRVVAGSDAAGGAHGFMLFSFYDVNADSLPDMFVGDAFNSNVYFWTNDGGGGISPDFSCQTESFFNGAGGGQGIFAIRILTTFGDLDGDGDPDALFGSGESNSSGLYYYENQGPSPMSPVFVQQDSSLIPELDLGASTLPAFADLDGDDDPDLFLAAVTQQRISYWQNIGSPTQPELALDTPSWLFIANTDWIAPEPADIDGDGDLDMLLGGKAGDIRWFRNDGNGASPSDFVEVTDHPDFGDPADRLFRLSLDSQATPRALDGDGDGDLDLIVGYYENQSPLQAPLHYFRNDGTPQSPDFVLASSDYQGAGDLGQGTAPVLGDLDGDLDPDLLVGRDDGTLAFFRNVGTAQYPAFVKESDKFAGIDVGARSVPALSDLDGDGDLDLIVGETGGGLNFYRNMTSSTVRPTSFALLEPALDADLAARGQTTRFRWGPSFASGGGEASYELRISPSPTAPPADWTVIPASSSEVDVLLYSTPYRFLPELWWTVVATDGCSSAPVPAWRHANHVTVDIDHLELPDGGDPIQHQPMDP
ncbi:MAG TPA: VCBS repeat-containing protein, partial [bacterium]|nr:VCBS repeat-containing protein [bacterium]